MLKGIDISNWQVGLDLSKLDIDFMICKATEGNNFVDGCCNGFIEQAKAKGILWGFYHFARNNKPEEEAEYFYKNTKNYFKNGIPVLDYEVENYDNVKWCQRFLNHLHEISGVWAMLYISASRCKQYENSWIPKKCGLWVAGYPRSYADWTKDDMPYNIYPFENAAIWQFTSSLILHGWWNKLDGDYAYMNKSAWLKYAQCTEKEPAKKKEKSIDDLVLETLLGEYGVNEDRKKMLGKNYEKVQNRINELYKVADEVIDGKWGNGWNRETALKGAGYPYSIVQRIVNEKLN